MHNKTSNTNTRFLLPILQTDYSFIVLDIATWAYQALEGLGYIGRTASCPPFYLLPQTVFYAQNIWTTNMSSGIRNLVGLIHWIHCCSILVNKALNYWVQAILLLALYLWKYCQTNLDNLDLSRVQSLLKFCRWKYCQTNLDHWDLSRVQSLWEVCHWKYCQKKLEQWDLLVKSPISVGSAPVKVLVNKTRSVRLVKNPISVGSVPLKVLSYKYR